MRGWVCASVGAAMLWCGTTAQAVDVGLLTGKALGGDYLAADHTQRAAWLLVAGRLALPDAAPGRQAEIGAGIGRCLDETLTVRTAEERVAVAVMKATPLAELTALCAAGLMPR